MMFLLSSTYEDYHFETYSCEEILGIFSTFDKADNALKTILHRRELDEKTGKEEKHGNLYAITFEHLTETECYSIQEIETDTILEDIQL
jgi:hypothetical protein